MEEGCQHHTMCLAYNCGETKFSDRAYLVHHCDTLGGNSGAPMYVPEFKVQPPAWQVVYGVHTSSSQSSNRGVRITKNLWYQLVAQIQ